MNLWNSYLNLFSHENPAVITGVIIATIAVLTFLLNFIIKPLYHRIARLFLKIEVVLGISLQIAESFNGTSVLPPLITVKITNRDNIPRYIQNPNFKLSRKINGDNTFVVPRNEGTYPRKLEPGEQITEDFSSISLNNQILNYLKPKDKVSIILFDTTGKKYKSNTFNVKFIKDHIQTANKLNSKD